MVEILYGKQVKDKKIEELQFLLSKVQVPFAKIIYAEGYDIGSSVYVRNKLKLAKENNINMEIAPLNWQSKTKQDILEQIIHYLFSFNHDNSICGYFIQLPIAGIDGEIKIDDFVEYIDSKKDLDGFTKENFANLYFNEDGLKPCTPSGVLDILDYYNISLEGADIVIVNRSHLIGLPLLGMLINRNATVTVCHSKTKDLKSKIKRADIVILGTGQCEFFDSSYFRNGQVIVDCTITRNSKNKLCGDLHPNVYKSKKDLKIVPSPKGVGLLTTTNLMFNCVKASEFQQ